MHKKDYLQRQFEEFGKVLANLLSLKKDRNWEEFEKEINEAVRKFTTLELNHLENLNPTDFEKEMLSASLAFDQKKALASLLFEQMNAYLEKKENVKYEQLKKKCESLYRILAEDLTQNEFDLEIHYRAELLKK